MVVSKDTSEEALLVTDSNNNQEAQEAADTSATSKRAKWQFSLIGGATACIVVLIINLVITIWSSVTFVGSETGDRSSRRIIYEGSCSDSRTINVVIHLVINIFSSILLASSNYGMQCLSAPTRADVDHAHTRRDWMDIGIPSFRNLRMVSRKRVSLWLLLVLSSVPLHLFFFVDEDFQLLWKDGKDFYEKSLDDKRRVKQLVASEHGRLDNLTNLECINEYAVAFQTKRNDVIVIVESVGSVDSVIGSPDTTCGSYRASADYSWICGWTGAFCTTCRSQLAKVRSQPNNWSPWGKRVKHCLSQPAEQMCRLNFDFRIAAVILVVNFVKAVTLVFIALRPPKEPLFVLGDAVQSFLVSPDETTTGACLGSARTARVGRLHLPCFIDVEPRRRGVAVTKTRWSWSILMYGLAFIASFSLLGWSVDIIPGPKDLKTLWDLGFGSANELTLISGKGWDDKDDSSLIANILVANLPQLVFSFFYFQYNSLFTCMAAAAEWSAYANKRRSLRVSSNPRGKQRSRYFLQLPYRYSIPLLLASILMHWMLSQSIFVVAIEQSGRWKLFTSGYSPIAMIFVIIIAAFMAAAVIITALRRLPTIMPVAASCSLAIAAACHHPDNKPQPDASVSRLQWGVMQRQRDELGRELTGHCGFSQYPVEKPEWGIVYR
ncbi:hypothetical protein FGSG_11545 [Fusarium graminearum PH-1]|uniref:Chromosome 2, complete genome n=1 Tax=Gibberella zeae (strain ATCC MYA-4620 / CBS 123657 / FGSC 9075 / NRRL 31084 / PH-1) TaxID=229533 RepID=I1S3Z3_GIBZE|nr:hypothetical protein FGSG_11545 [Fusarium graminearum PH-1]ESU08315.1 hypothetical protein FGSG_11545 [Fusarium graminearum PH-1]CEF79790.1 unnamed protein product [Fusarium graminearum]|eukprot:XP_011323081.1 hypothetical protein FGSG_11545 [Fusarium graminearum PH-1]